MIQPRLLADYAATPTRRERAAVRAHWRAASPTLWADDADAERNPCAVCASTDHETDQCPHGTPLTLI